MFEMKMRNFGSGKSYSSLLYMPFQERDFKDKVTNLLEEPKNA